ncbi:hypothetical protein KUL25_19760 [Rhodobacteraceae bacterium N5(2021)]|uniref:Uncharacterized protein n=1 Tax=Gymnodinialimonas phycosphaerae TaxID=2841589 RepID=A0A975TUR2_9RHOB|nr:hypothetical protein [Gymnodinialimonas phycosphaerae]MBY4895001.1 hypothetical protein [Gymnodinialimonas phycosphaerae]
MLKGPRGLLVTLLGAAIVVAGAIYFGFQDQKGDAETARLFMTHAAAGETAEAHALLHASIAERHSVEDLAAMLTGMEPYTQINFPTFSFSTTNGQRTAALLGTGTTDSGCESALQFNLLNGEITFFDIAPLCRDGATDA